jgi:threonine dehydrogenase-like Zn-dependent dehydrogenase
VPLGPAGRWATCASTAGRPRCVDFFPELIDLVWKREIDPGKVFDLTLPLVRVAEGYRAMDERRAIKMLLCP